jgi:two-component system, cell cycle sensor histidine kinase DivJ
VNLPQPVREYVRSVWEGGSIQPLAGRYRAFTTPRLVWSVVTLSTLPIYLLAVGMPTVPELALICWLAVPTGSAYLLIRSGRPEIAGFFSALSLVLLSLWLAKLGASPAYAAIWLVLAVVEGALILGRRMLTVLLACAGVTTLVIAVKSAGAVASGVDGTAGMAVAISYAMMLALSAAWTGAEEKARRQAGDARYQLLAHHMTDVIGRIARDGVAAFISPAAEKLLNVPASDLLGHGLFDRIHVLDRPAYLTALAEAAHTKESRAVEFRVRANAASADSARSGGFLWLEMRCSPLDQQAEGNAEVVAVFSDVTARKLQERSLESARREAERANAAKTRFLATMSHELRTPLNAVIGFSEMLCHEPEMAIDQTRRLEYARLIHESGQHLLSMVNLVLDMSKIESGNFEITAEPFAPGPVLRSCCDLLALKANEAGLDLTTQIAEDLPEVVADKRALKQVMFNILGNAIKFTPRGGRVLLSAKANTSELLITVADTGIGISPTDLKRVGDPFFQVRNSYDRPYDGAGLGLSIVRGLLALHGGKMEISSVLNEGTSVLVRFPLNCETPAIDEPMPELLPFARPEAEAAPVRVSSVNEQVRKSA